MVCRWRAFAADEPIEVVGAGLLEPQPAPAATIENNTSRDVVRIRPTSAHVTVETMASEAESTPGSGRLEIQRTERYVLHDAIAHGGMASVHIGIVEGSFGFARVVAIKRLHQSLATNPRFVTMLIEEAHMVSRIRHLNVVPTLDVIAKGEEVFVIMEYVKGCSLGHLVNQTRHAGRSVDARLVTPIVSGALRGLHAAHEVVDAEGRVLQVVHCDVSPQNILVGVGGLPRVIDFGVASARGKSEGTREGEFKGKLAYAAPEQLTEKPVSPRTDVFAMGIVLWELLTNEPLFTGDSDAKVYTAALKRTIPDPLDVLSTTQPVGWEARSEEIAPLVPIAMRALQRDPARRYETAEQMAVELDATGVAARLASVGAWVRSVAHDKILEEARLVAAAEAGVESRRSSWSSDDIRTRVITV